LKNAVEDLGEKTPQDIHVK